MKFAHVTSTCIRNICILIMHDYLFFFFRRESLGTMLNNQSCNNTGYRKKPEFQ